MDTTDVIQFTSLFILLIFSAFFSSAETALSLVTKVKLHAMEEEGKKHVKLLNKIMDNYERVITTILIGNNIVNLSASALTTIITLKIWGNPYVSLATGILTFLVLIFGEIVPKTIARRKSDELALSFAPIINIIIIVLFPIVFIIEKLSKLILLILGQSKDDSNTITESELRSYVDVSKEDGVIESDEHQIISNVFDFSDSIAKDIMIPRIDMTTISYDATYKEVMKVFRDSMYTRLPVYKGEIENIIGFINVKDLLRLKAPETFNVSKFLREAYYTFEYKKTSDLLIEMRSSSKNLSFVNNEYGETVGMITLEDLLEEIVGQIRDEYDADEYEQITKDDDGYLIEAKMKLEDINDVLGTDFASDDYDSIGGLVLDQLDRIPEDSESVILENGTVLKVCGIKSNRIDKVHVTLPKSDENEEATDK
ncbi:MAG: HlyC/CorC family transporter [Lachnospiraceae bacterium]|nr:HlyC/CorC family transporter [Lachnospiraceae bacterium]MBP5600417.1 HlyC/CorC family transporter [Lachnospiraceae bacterium]